MKTLLDIIDRPKTVKGRKPKKSEPRTESINIRATKTEIATLKAIVEIRREKNKTVSQSDILFGGMQAGDAIRKIWECRKEIELLAILHESTYNSHRRFNEDIAIRAQGKLELCNKILSMLDRALTV